MDQAQEFCQNCEKSLPESKFDLHLGYCRRNIRKCPDCNRPYDINEEDEHKDQFHSFSNCTHCGISLPSAQIQAHTKNCQAKPVACFYCDLPIPTDKAEEHRIQCESRTRTCEICDRPVTNRDFFTHIETCEGPPSIAVPSSTTTNQYSSPYQSQSTSLPSSSQSSYSYPGQVIRTYTRVTTTDPRTGETTTVIKQDSNSDHRVIRRPYNSSENIIRHEARVVNGQTTYTTSNSSTYTPSAQTVPSSYVHRTVDRSPQMSEADDPELQAVLLASLGYQDENAPDLYTQILKQQELQKQQQFKKK